MHLTKRRRLSFRMVLLIQKLWRVYDGFLPSFSPSSFFPSLSFSASNFPSNERNGHATLTFHHLRHPRWHKVVEEDVSGFLARKDPLLLLSYRSSILFVSPIPMQETVSNSANKASPSPRFPSLSIILCLLLLLFLQPRIYYVERHPPIGCNCREF